MPSLNPEDYGILPTHIENVRLYNPTPDTIEQRFDSVLYPFFPDKLVEVSPGVGTHAKLAAAEKGLVEVPYPDLEKGQTEEQMLEDAHTAGLQAWVDNLDNLVGLAQAVIENCEGHVPRVTPMPSYRKNLKSLEEQLVAAQAYLEVHPTPKSVEPTPPVQKKGKGDRQFA